MSSKLIFLSTIKARYPVGDKPEECDSTRENSSKHSGRGDGGASGGGGGGNVGGIICQRCQDVKRGPLKRIQVCEYCKEWKRLEALLPSQVRRKTPTEVSTNFLNCTFFQTFSPEKRKKNDLKLFNQLGCFEEKKTIMNKQKRVISVIVVKIWKSFLVFRKNMW